MKAYALDLREPVVKFINAGGSKAEAARRFDLGRRTVCRYLAAAQKGTLTPKTSRGHWRKLDPQNSAPTSNNIPTPPSRNSNRCLASAIMRAGCVCANWASH
jgi:transposase